MGVWVDKLLRWVEIYSCNECESVWGWYVVMADSVVYTITVLVCMVFGVRINEVVHDVTFSIWWYDMHDIMCIIKYHAVLCVSWYNILCNTWYHNKIYIISWTITLTQWYHGTSHYLQYALYDIIICYHTCMILYNAWSHHITHSYHDLLHDILYN